MVNFSYKDRRCSKRLVLGTNHDRRGSNCKNRLEFEVLEYTTGLTNSVQISTQHKTKRAIERFERDILTKKKRV